MKEPEKMYMAVCVLVFQYNYLPIATGLGSQYWAYLLLQLIAVIGYATLTVSAFMSTVIN